MPDIVNQIFDGFDYGIQYSGRPNIYSNWWMCIGQMEALRRVAGDYRPRQWVVPADFVALAARSTFHYAFPVKCGSYLYGLNFSPLSGEFEAVNANTFSLNVTEACSNQSLYQQVVSGSVDRSPTGGDVFSGDVDKVYPPIQLLTTPRLILSPGEVAVELTNNGATARACQLVLFFAEPRG